MARENLVALLERQGVRPTAVRLILADVLERADAPLSAMEIERILDTVDRSTITRGLSIFAEHGLIHSVDDSTGIPKYEWCRSPGGHSPGDGHAHFHCRKCGRTFCLHDIPLPSLPLPAGYEPEETSLVIIGICPRCRR